MKIPTSHPSILMFPFLSPNTSRLSLSSSINLLSFTVHFSLFLYVLLSPNFPLYLFLSPFLPVSVCLSVCLSLLLSLSFCLFLSLSLSLSFFSLALTFSLSLLTLSLPLPLSVYFSLFFSLSHSYTYTHSHTHILFCTLRPDMTLVPFNDSNQDRNLLGVSSLSAPHTQLQNINNVTDVQNSLLPGRLSDCLIPILRQSPQHMDQLLAMLDGYLSTEIQGMNDDDDDDDIHNNENDNNNDNDDLFLSLSFALSLSFSLSISLSLFTHPSLFLISPGRLLKI